MTLVGILINISIHLICQRTISMQAQIRTDLRFFHGSDCGIVVLVYCTGNLSSNAPSVLLFSDYYDLDEKATEYGWMIKILHLSDFPSHCHVFNHNSRFVIFSVRIESSNLKSIFYNILHMLVFDESHLKVISLQDRFQ